MKKEKQCKWYDPFFRTKLLSIYGSKRHSESWTEYAYRVGAKLPVGADKKRINGER